MKKMYNVVQGQPRYNDPSKNDWVQLGVMWDDSKGMRIKFNALPLPNKEGDVWVRMYPKDDKANQIASQIRQRAKIILSQKILKMRSHFNG